MTEHVCEITQDYPGIPYDHDEFSGSMERRELVVRCDDCAFFTFDDRTGHGWCDEWVGETDQDGFCWRGRFE